MAKKLSPRALELLILIDECTQWEGDERPGKKITKYFIPRFDYMWIKRRRQHTMVNGGGDAAIIRSFLKAGLVSQDQHQRVMNPYACQITEDGIERLAREEH